MKTFLTAAAAVLAVALAAAQDGVRARYDEMLAKARASAARQDNAQSAIEYGTALTLAQELKDPGAIGVSSRGLGLAHYRLGRITEALTWYRRGLPAAEAAGDTTTLAELWRGIGVAERQLGRLEASLEAAQRSIALSRELGDERTAAGMLGNLAAIYSDMGDLRRRQDVLLESLRIAEAKNYDNVRRDAMDNLGITYLMQHDTDIGIDMLERLLVLKDAAKDDQRSVAVTLNNLAIGYRQRHDHAAALATYTRALGLSREVKDERGIAVALLNIGELHRVMRSWDLALAATTDSLARHEALRHVPGRSRSLMTLARIHLDMDNPAAAHDAARQALELARSTGANFVLMDTLPLAGEASRRLGRDAEARAAFDEAIGLVERTRGALMGGSADGNAFFADYVAPYHGIVALDLAAGRTREALAMAEQAKARQLFDLLHVNRVDIDRAMTASEKAEERRLAAEVSRLNVSVARASDAAGGSAAEPQRQLDEAIRRLESFRAALYRTHPELRVQRGQPPALTGADLAGLVPDTATALVEFVAAERELMAFVVERKADGTIAVSAERTPLARAQLEREVDAFRRQLATRDLTYRQQAAALHSRLLGPLTARLRGKTLVGVVPDGPLWGLPFQALVAPGGRHVIEDHAIFYAPSLATLSAMRSMTRTPAAGASLLAIGNPALPGAAREAQQLRDLYGRASSLLIGTDAPERQWHADASRYRVLHVATHGVLNSRNPLYSYLQLGAASPTDDGLLEAREILRSALNADLAVLSACETARGQVLHGEGSIGMSWAFLVAGTPTTVVSQWRVESSSTSDLMIGFHRRLVGATPGPIRGKSRALQRATIDLLRTPAYRHPFYWAAFTVIGDGY